MTTPKKRLIYKTEFDFIIDFQNPFMFDAGVFLRCLFTNMNV